MRKPLSSLPQLLVGLRTLACKMIRLAGCILAFTATVLFCYGFVLGGLNNNRKMEHCGSGIARSWKAPSRKLVFPHVAWHGLLLEA